MTEEKINKFHVIAGFAEAIRIKTLNEPESLVHNNAVEILRICGQGEWISTREQLPPEYESVLFIVKNSSIVYYGCRNSNINGNSVPYSWHSRDVTYWMPLPQLPNAELR